MTTLKKITLQKHQTVQSFEFNAGGDNYKVKWMREPPDSDGYMRHSITVYILEHVSEGLNRWFNIVDKPVIIRNWKPTAKRSQKLLLTYLQN